MPCGIVKRNFKNKKSSAVTVVRGPVATWVIRAPSLPPHGPASRGPYVANALASGLWFTGLILLMLLSQRHSRCQKHIQSHRQAPGSSRLVCPALMVHEWLLLLFSDGTSSVYNHFQAALKEKKNTFCLWLVFLNLTFNIDILFYNAHGCIRQH